jgi:hypothetical protein
MTEIWYEKAVFLSPHHDDVCFSIAGIVLSQGSGALVNIFTRSEYVAKRLALPADRNERIEFVTKLRAAEDQRFAEAAGLVRHDLMLHEPSLRGFKPFDSSDLLGEVLGVKSVLLSFLERHFEAEPRGARAAIFCPMGIGGHRDHLLTLLAVKVMMTFLLRHFDVYFYEDLPYASVPSVRGEGIARALAIFSGSECCEKDFHCLTICLEENWNCWLFTVHNSSPHPGPPISFRPKPNPRHRTKLFGVALHRRHEPEPCLVIQKSAAVTLRIFGGSAWTRPMALKERLIELRNTGRGSRSNPGLTSSLGRRPSS